MYIKSLMKTFPSDLESQSIPMVERNTNCFNALCDSEFQAYSDFA